jgi:copper(I)-binding protein
MTRAAVVITLAALVAGSLVEPGFAEVSWQLGAFATSSHATPAPYENGEMPDAAPVSLLIQNHGGVDDRLLGGSTAAADRVDIHLSRLVHGVRQMLPNAEGITIPAGDTLILEPASDHLMLVGLREDLIQGQTFPLTLSFAHAGEATVTVRVRRKVDAAGLPPIPPATAGDLTISLASAPPITAGRRTQGGGRRGPTPPPMILFEQRRVN